ncbi:MAG: hypothetical protein HY650_00310 [Acidobacteria bacterium]|nr:hypothetical protein [Acidobacteriota bacterium]
MILERRRAGEVYHRLRWQALDPGLLQMGEPDADEARKTTVFTARIVPIPAWGTKRLEIEYHEMIPVEELEAFFALPLRPDVYQTQTIGRLSIRFELRSQHAISGFEEVGGLYPLQIQERSPHLIRGGFEGRNMNLTEDFAVRYAFDGSRADTLEISTHRNISEDGSDTPGGDRTSDRGANSRTEGEATSGFFQASALLAMPNQESTTASGGTGQANGRPRTLIILFDASLSMQWEKLERSFQALGALLRSLRPSDRFNLLLFNSEVIPFSESVAAADTPTIDRALQFVASSRLRGERIPSWPSITPSGS